MDAGQLAEKETIVRKLANGLSEATGVPLSTVEGSLNIEKFSITATMRGEGGLGLAVRVTFIVKIFLTEEDGDSVQVWALLFTYMNAQRVAPAGKVCWLWRWTDEVGWKADEWEADEYDEWRSLENLWTVDS